ncbi:MAG TPA: hypothetical protein VFN33_02935 [Gaiellaceae bacterium]|nr:hypothetical protein [Gaiellaceae bacterium]
MARRVLSVLAWTCLIVLGAFGVVFSFANYPLYATGLVLLVLILVVYAERTRRVRQQARDEARMRARASRPLT